MLHTHTHTHTHIHTYIPLEARYTCPLLIRYHPSGTLLTVLGLGLSYQGFGLGLGSQGLGLAVGLDTCVLDFITASDDDDVSTLLQQAALRVNNWSYFR